MNIFEKISADNRISLVIGIILIVAIIGIIILSIQAYVKSTSDENVISILEEQTDTLKSQLSTAQAELDLLASQVMSAEGRVASVNDQQAIVIANLQDELAIVSAQISSLTNQINGVASQVTGLATEVSSDGTDILTIQAQLSTITSQLSTLSNAKVSLDNRVLSLENTVASLTDIVNRLSQIPSNPIMLFSSHTFSQGFSSQTVVYTFTPPYHGSIYISGTSNSITGYIRVINNTTSTSQYYSFGTGTIVNVVVSAGNNYSIVFGNTDSAGTVTATLTAVYYY